jgi:uncharacterized membrane protein YkoI
MVNHDERKRCNWQHKSSHSGSQSSPSWTMKSVGALRAAIAAARLSSRALKGITMNKLCKSLLLTGAVLATLPAVEQGGGSDNSSTSSSSYNISNDSQSQAQLKKLPEQAWPVVTKEARMHEARISDVDRSDKNGVVFYKVNFKNQDRSWSAKVLEDGTLVDIKKETTSWEDVPKEVRDGILREVKSMGTGACVTEVETTRRNGQMCYKAEIEMDGKAQDCTFDANGQKMPDQQQ